MTRNSRKMLILGVFCLIGAAAAIPGFMLSSRNSNISSVKSALLNPKYVSEVDEIMLSFPTAGYEGSYEYSGGTWIFRKGTDSQGNVRWICSTDDGFSFPANVTVIEQLLDRASDTVSMAEVSDSYTVWSALGLSDDSAIHLSFIRNGSDGNTQTFSSLFFGYENADGSMIYVRSDRKSTSWRISNDYSSYLRESSSLWADQRLLPTGSLDETDASRTCIRFEASGKSGRIYNDASGGTSFDDLIHTLLSLRSSEFVSYNDLSVSETAPDCLLTVTLEGSSSDDSYGFHVYEIWYADEPVYFVQNFGIVNHDESHYYQVISSWTLNRITEALGLQ